MTASLLLYGALVLTFATWVTAHVLVSVAFLLAWRFRLAAVALLVIPVAPMLAYRSGRRLLAALWVLAAVAYLVLRVGWG